jgi:hypothetical protein
MSGILERVYPSGPWSARRQIIWLAALAIGLVGGMLLMKVALDSGPTYPSPCDRGTSYYDRDACDQIRYEDDRPDDGIPYWD